jgi:hypothetical protein
VWRIPSSSHFFILDPTLRSVFARDTGFQATSDTIKAGIRQTFLQNSCDHFLGGKKLFSHTNILANTVVNLTDILFGNFLLGN